MGISSNRWLGLAYKWLLPLALVAAISVAAISVISARSGGDECEGGKQHWSFGARFSVLAELADTDVDSLKAALGEGQTLAEVAEGNGVEARTVIDALVENANERIDAVVKAGKLTEEEAETKKSEAATRIEDVVNNGFDRDGLRGWGKSRWRG